MKYRWQYNGQDLWRSSGLCLILVRDYSEVYSDLVVSEFTIYNNISWLWWWAPVSELSCTGVRTLLHTACTARLWCQIYIWVSPVVSWAQKSSVVSLVYFIFYLLKHTRLYFIFNFFLRYNTFLNMHYLFVLI